MLFHANKALNEALGLVNNKRRSDYGDPFENLAMVGKIWGAMLKRPPIPPRTVCAMMVAFKIARDETGAKKDDNIADILGYGALMAEMKDKDLNVRKDFDDGQSAQIVPRGTDKNVLGNSPSNEGVRGYSLHPNRGDQERPETNSGLHRGDAKGKLRSAADDGRGEGFDEFR